MLIAIYAASFDEEATAAWLVSSDLDREQRGTDLYRDEGKRLVTINDEEKARL